MIDEHGLAELLAPLASYAGQWWVAGGWAIDLACQRQVRAHKDVDVLVRDDESMLLFDHLRHFHPVIEHPHTLQRREWGRDDVLVAGPDTVTMDSLPGLQLLIGKFNGTEWIYPRGTGRIRQPIRQMTHLGRGGITIQAPEAVLLFKSREDRPENDVDFHAALPQLDDRQRAWLHAAIAGRIPDHPWLSELAPDLHVVQGRG